jgi:hypothetical protein
MHLIDQIIARIPISEVVIKTSIKSYAVIERIECGVMPAFFWRGNGRYFTFYSNYSSNYFIIQSTIREPDGKDSYPTIIYVSIGPVGFPIKIETSPIFFGRVFDDEQGSTIRGHFGFAIPHLLLVVALISLIMARFISSISVIANGLTGLLLLGSILSLREFIDERDCTIDFLTGLFYNVPCEENPSDQNKSDR